MLSLKEQSLLHKTSAVKSLKEFNLYVKGLPIYVDLSLISKNFWLSLIPRIGHGITATCFRSLPDQYWPQLANSLLNSLYCKYLYVDDDPFSEEIEEGQIVTCGLYKENDAPDVFSNDSGYVNSIIIPAIQFPIGISGWVITLKTSTPSSSYSNFLVSSLDGNDANDIIFVIAHMLIKHIAKDTNLVKTAIVYETSDHPKSFPYRHKPFNLYDDCSRVYTLEDCEKIETTPKSPINLEGLQTMVKKAFNNNYDIDDFEAFVREQGRLDECFHCLDLLYIYSDFNYIGHFDNPNRSELPIGNYYFQRTKTDIVIDKRQIV